MVRTKGGKVKVFYHNDLDGQCSAAIINLVDREMGLKTRGDLTFIEIDHSDRVPVETITEDENIYIVDFSFKPEVMKEVLKITSDVTWIDHHKTARDYDYGIQLKGIWNFEDKAMAGCELTWQYWFPDRTIPYAVRLIGDRDKWAWKCGADTANFTTGLMLYDTSPQSKVWDDLLKDSFAGGKSLLGEVIQKGVITIEYRDNLCKDYIKNYGFETEFEGYKCYALNLQSFGSEAFGELFSKYDICIPFVFNGKDWIISLYSKTIDVGTIAKKYGGGGHTGASGFVWKGIPFKESR